MARTLARRLAKVAYFLLILFVIGRSLGDPYLWVNHDLGYWVVHLFYGNEDAGVENIEDVLDVNYLGRYASTTLAAFELFLS
ncbi:hypothetical protein ABW07_24270 [Pluralibacter gergoviae]|nr:hypothetical protein ABW07_24270 [Pluralibacter gergoviae]